MSLAARVGVKGDDDARCAAGIVHSISRSGHRGPYTELFRDLFGLTPLVSEPSFRSALQLVRAKRLFLVTADDAIVWYCVIALCRRLAFKTTVGLYLRPQECFKSGEPTATFRRLFFRTLAFLGFLRLITITPHSVEARYAEVSSAGVFDPQYWDLHDGQTLRRPQPTALSAEILRKANGRRVICFAGHVTRIKGFEYFVALLRDHKHLSDTCLFVAAGANDGEVRHLGEDFLRLGGFAINRTLSDVEIESLYTVSDAMWACYAPEYDQASGIFGRALQLGVPVIVRDGSLIHRLSKRVSASVVALKYNDSAGAQSLVAEVDAFAANTAGLSLDASTVAQWRTEFLHVIGGALNLPFSRV
jgi:hypothetical protein